MRALTAGLCCLLLGFVTTAHAKNNQNVGFAVTHDVLFLLQPTEEAKLALFERNGDWITSVGQEEPNQPDTIIAPVELLTDIAGNCYVLDQFGPSIIVVSATGTVLRRWGERGFDEGQLRKPVDFGMDQNGTLYVLDLGREAVVKFNRSGRFMGEVRLDPEDAKDLHWSNAIAVGPEGDFLLVSDASTGDAGLLRHIRHFESNGELRTKTTLAKITGVGEITDISILPGGKWLFTDYQPAVGQAYTGAVYLFSSEGSYETRWFIRDNRRGLSYSPVRAKAVGDELYVLSHTNLICRVDTSGGLLQTWGAGEL